MPNARVGAMPPTQAVSEHQHGEVKKRTKERRKQKGITMEDLKEQTAARLAKEQRRRNAVTANRNARGKILSQDHMKPKILNSGSLDPSPSCENSIGSSSFHSSHPPFSQNSVDDFPHGTFDFANRDPALAHPVRHHQSEMQHSPNMQVYVKHQTSNHYNPPAQNLTPHKSSHGNYFHGPGSQYSNHKQRDFSQNKKTNQGNQMGGTGGAGAGASNSSKLPHGLTVQELKQMTRARLAAEAAESTDNPITPAVSTETDLSTQVHMNNQPRQRVYSQDSHSGQMNNNRQRIVSTDSFGSSQRQRLGSVESFGSSASAAAFTNSGYHQRTYLTPSMSNDQFEQPSVSSFSYDAVDNESLTSALGSESFFGSETVGSRTTKYSAGSSVYKLPYSSTSKGSPCSHGTKVTTNVRNDGWNGHFNRPSSPSSVPTVAQSCSSFGASDNENASSFFTLPAMGRKLERLVSAGAVVPNSVAESVLGPSEENVTNIHGTGDAFHDYVAPANSMSPNSNGGKSVEEATPYTFPWSTNEKQEVPGNLDLAGLQSELNSLLHLDGRNDNGPDDFLLTFHSRGNAVVGSNDPTSPENHYYSSPFQAVPEERVIQNLMSRDVNVPESFLDDHAQDLAVPKLGSRMRRKKSRN